MIDWLYKDSNYMTYSHMVENKTILYANSDLVL